MPEKQPASARCVLPLFPFPGHTQCSKGLAGDLHVCIAQGTRSHQGVSLGMGCLGAFPTSGAVGSRPPQHIRQGWEQDAAGSAKAICSCPVFSGARETSSALLRTGQALPRACPAAHAAHGIPPRLCLIPLPGHCLVCPPPLGTFGREPKGTSYPQHSSRFAGAVLLHTAREGTWDSSHPQGPCCPWQCRMNPPHVRLAAGQDKPRWFEAGQKPESSPTSPQNPFILHLVPSLHTGLNLPGKA